ncbi:unnamed protein product [Adineta steineri]|uniref:Uncharacterized protein n=1 Tax=Adineta steineri TaxID=433720 RepID=A0A819CJ56_9BILA|nr:unnamed protein product [Adineta steineri]CAF3818997.1 unnamed protein product [Adineta steineri]
MSNNTTSIDLNLNYDYDRNGAVIYTVVILLFYSLSLFCTLILNIDPDDDSYEKKWSVYKDMKNRKAFHTSHADVLNILADQTLRTKYWRIYYGDEKLNFQPEKFISAESKRLFAVTQRVNQLNNEQRKHSNKHEEFNEINERKTYRSLQSSPEVTSTPSSFLFKFRRARSTSVPSENISLNTPIERRSYDILSQTPLCKPPIITITKHP